MTGQSSGHDTVTAGALFDEETSKAVEAMYRTVDAERRRAIVLEAIALQSGERVIDVGTGPGFLAVEIADVVGPNGSVLAVDIALGIRGRVRVGPRVVAAFDGAISGGGANPLKVAPPLGAAAWSWFGW